MTQNQGRLLGHVTSAVAQGLPAWGLMLCCVKFSIILSLNLCFANEVQQNNSVWAQSLEPWLTLSLPSHCLPRTGSWPRIPAAWYPGPRPAYPLVRPALRPGATIGSKLLRVRPSWSAIALCSWLGPGWEWGQGQVPAPCRHEEEQGCGHPHPELAALWHIQQATQQGPLTHTQSRHREFLSMEVEIIWGSHICCGLEQQTLGKGILTSPPPARLLLNHFSLSSTNYVAGST